MIEINELRVGNWVKFFCDPNTGGCDCNQPHINFEHQIETLNNDGDVCIGHITGFGIKNEEIHGIEITGSILEQFGFKTICKSTEGCNWEEYEYSYKFSEKSLKHEYHLFSMEEISADTEFYVAFQVNHISQMKNVVLEAKGIVPKIKYVHQLQNIMFFSTGIELKKK